MPLSLPPVLDVSFNLFFLFFLPLLLPRILLLLPPIATLLFFREIGLWLWLAAPVPPTRLLLLPPMISLLFLKFTGVAPPALILVGLLVAFIVLLKLVLLSAAMGRGQVIFLASKSFQWIALKNTCFFTLLLPSFPEPSLVAGLNDSNFTTRSIASYFILNPTNTFLHLVWQSSYNAWAMDSLAWSWSMTLFTSDSMTYFVPVNIRCSVIPKLHQSTALE